MFLRKKPKGWFDVTGNKYRR